MDALNWMKSSQALSILITDNVHNGNCLVKRLNRNGISVSGLTVTTSARIAKELLIRDLAAKGEFKRIQEVTDDIGAFILEGILRAHPEQYGFVPQESLCTATAAEILSNLNMIRENQVTDAFRNAADPKTVQLECLIREYEDKLMELGFYDRCMLLRAGLKIVSGNTDLQASESVGLLFTDRISVLEKAFLQAYAPDAACLSLEKPDKPPVWHFYKSYGIWNEAEYILDDISKKQIPFGQVRIVYTSQDYEPSLQAAFGERRVPICFTSGRPVSGMHSIRMLLSLIQWASGGYCYEDLKNVVLNPLFEIPFQEAGQAEEGDQRPVNGVREFLKGIDDKIGWGLDRYRKYLKDTAEAAKNGEESVHAPGYLEFLDDATGIFAGIGEPVDVAALFDAMIVFMKKYTRRTEDNKMILPLLEQQSRELSYMLPFDSLTESLTFLKDQLENMTAEEQEDPGAVAACRISGVELLDRPFIYMIGLADRHYGISLIESPVLNDLEREKYLDLSAGNVSLCRDRAARRLQNYMDSLELSETGEIHMGYCCFDTVKQEMLSPSALFLSMREKYGSEIKNLPLIEYPRVIEENTIVPYDAVWGTDDHVPPADEKEGKEDAGKERPGGGEENGGPDTPGEVIERSMFFSPSGLDTFLSCPAKYNYQRIRRIPEEDYAVPDSSIWLNAADKGSYFHLILQEYIDQCFVGIDRISPEIDMDVFERVFKNATEQTLELVPVESPAVARQEQEEIRDAAVRYLTNLHQEFSDPSCPWQVLACEKAFGRRGEAGLQQDYDFIFHPDPLIYGDGAMEDCHDLFHLTFSGIIDRLDGYIDKSGKRHFRIVDYKTGHSDNFKKYKLDKKKNRETTQHSIYQMYAGQLGTVDVFEYHFPFEEKEEDQVISIREFGDLMHDNENHVLNCLHDSFVLGYYSPSEKTGGCSFCKYSDICMTKI